MEEGTPGRENYGASRDLGTGRGQQGGATRRGKLGTACMRNSFGTPGMGGKHRQAVEAGGRERRPGGRLICDQEREGGEEVGANIERSGVEG